MNTAISDTVLLLMLKSFTISFPKANLFPDAVRFIQGVRRASMDNVPPCYTAGLSSIPARHSALRSAGKSPSSEESQYLKKKDNQIGACVF